VIREWVRDQARERLKISSIQGEEPNLHLLDGATAETIERLNEESITSIQHLAMVSPLRLLLRTNIDWLVILDLIDQALLQLYVGALTPKLREIWVRSTIDLADIADNLATGTDEEKKAAEAVIDAIATHLDMPVVFVRKQVETVGGDPQVIFIWNLWSEITGEEEEEDDEKEPAQDAEPPLTVVAPPPGGGMTA
jgi:hypothetical protein